MIHFLKARQTSTSAARAEATTEVGVAVEDGDPLPDELSRTI